MISQLKCTFDKNSKVTGYYAMILGEFKEIKTEDEFFEIKKAQRDQYRKIWHWVQNTPHGTEENWIGDNG